MNLILDVVVLVLLGMTIVYAARLSLQLKRLRDSRGDMDKIVRDLVRNVDKAERAIVMLRESADEHGVKLQRTIGNAVSLADELQLMTESGDRLASRLEKLVDGVRPITQDIQARTDALEKQAEIVAPAPKMAPAAQAARKVVKDAANAPAAVMPAAEVKSYTDHLRKLDDDAEVVPSMTDRMPMFSIRDVEVERGIDPLEQGVADDPTLYSEAERDLYRALKGLTDR